MSGNERRQGKSPPRSKVDTKRLTVIGYPPMRLSTLISGLRKEIASSTESQETQGVIDDRSTP
jgi:hypothetical protein